LEKLDRFTKYDLKEISEEEALLLQEQYLISPALTKSKAGAAFVSEDRKVSVMVNEEDHLRQQFIVKGLELFRAYERLTLIDDVLGSQYDFAFDEKLGYLTACPSNLGTGMRASVMMFLPGLIWNGELKKILPTLKAGGFTVRGAFGEGTQGEGYVYQISNERTLGTSELDLIDQMMEIALNVCDLEKRARAKMLQNSEVEIKDRCLRAYGTLTHCAMLSLSEFHAKMADVKLGIIFGFFQTESLDEFQDFIDGMRATVFRVNNGLRDASEKDCDIVRAETVRRVLPQLVRISKDWE